MDQSSIMIPDEVLVALGGEETIRQTLERIAIHFENEKWISHSLFLNHPKFTDEELQLAEKVYQLLRAIAHELANVISKNLFNIWKEGVRNFVLLFFYREEKQEFIWIEALKNGSIKLKIFSPLRTSPIYERIIVDSGDLLHIFPVTALLEILNNPQQIFNTIINNSREYSKWYREIMDRREIRLRFQNKLKFTESISPDTSNER